MKANRVLILGGGPAGCTAAIYTARAGLDVTLLEGPQAGGQLTITTEIENFPGFPDGIGGAQLMAEMKKQAGKFGTKFAEGIADKVDLLKRPFKVSAGAEKYSADALIIATGASAGWLGLPSEKKLYGKGVSACATCDGFFFKNKTVMVVGGGDTAIEEALFLTRFASSVHVVHRRDKLRAGKYLEERAFANKKINFIWDSVVEDILDPKKGAVTGVVLKNVKTGKSTEHSCDGIFVAIGHKPNSEIFKGMLDMDENGYIKTVAGRPLSNIEGVFVAGDVADPRYRQAITAAGSGCAAALEAERYLFHASGV